jgi:hypothetical protein
LCVRAERRCQRRRTARNIAVKIASVARMGKRFTKLRIDGCLGCEETSE